MLCCGLVVIAAFDVPFQLWQHSRDLQHDARGSARKNTRRAKARPETRGRIREAQRALARGRMMQEVPKADVVDHQPDALRRGAALRRDAHARADRGGQGRRPARGHASAKSPPSTACRIVEAPPLARALYRSVEIGHEVPAALYVAVAQVLTYVYQLQGARCARGATAAADPAVNYDH